MTGFLDFCNIFGFLAVSRERKELPKICGFSDLKRKLISRLLDFWILALYWIGWQFFLDLYTEFVGFVNNFFWICWQNFMDLSTNFYGFVNDFFWDLSYYLNRLVCSSVRWSVTIFTPFYHACTSSCYPMTTSLRGSHGLSAWRARWTKSSRPEGPPNRSWGPEGPLTSSM